MIDIPVVPAAPQPVSAPAQAAAPITPVPAVVTDVPDKIQQLVRQIQVSATVEQPPIDGTITLDSALGNITVLLPQLAKGAQQDLTQQFLSLLQSQKPLTLVIQPGSPPTQAYLLLPQTANSGTLQPATAVSEAAQLLQTANSLRQPLTVGTTLPALVLPQNVTLPGSTSPAATNYAQPTPENFPAPQSTPNPQGQSQGNLSGQQQPSLAQPAPTANAAPNPLSLLQPGNNVNLRIDGISLPLPTLSGTSAALQTPGPNQILATVTGIGPDGQLILKAGANTLYVNQPIEAPVGSTLLVTLEPARASALTTLAADAPSFASLPQTLAALSQINPQLAQQVIENMIPQPGAALPGALLFFMSAFKQGNVRTWLGDDAVDALNHAGKFELLGKLAGDFERAGQTANDQTVGEWRAYPIPMNANQAFQLLTLYVHDNGDRQSSQGVAAKAGTNHVRFVIDMRMSRLGSMQLDGFVQPRKLDMIVRSENVLPDGLHQDLRQTYTRALGAIDYAGSLNFQVGRQYWLNIQKAVAGGAAVLT